MILEQEHFAVMARLHGMHSIPEGKGTIHQMELGKTILLDEYDSWIPCDQEDFTQQMLRVSLSPQEKARLEQVRLRLVAIYSSSPLYQARAAKDPEYWNKFSVGGVR